MKRLETGRLLGARGEVRREATWLENRDGRESWGRKGLRTEVPRKD